MSRCAIEASAVPVLEAAAAAKTTAEGTANDRRDKVAADSRFGSTVCFVALLALFVTVPVAAQDVKITVSPGQGFAKYSKYTWKRNRIAPGVSPQEREAIEATIKGVVNQELSKKGYREDPQNPDFLIEIRAGTLPGELLTSANRDLRVPDSVTLYDSQLPGGPGVSTWLAITAGAQIVVTDAASDAAAWEAVVTKKYKNPDKYKDRKKLEPEIVSFFKRGVRDFPPRKN